MECTQYLFVPLEQDGTAVFRRPLKALVDVLHQQVHAVLIQRLHSLLDITCLEGTEHFQHQPLSTVLHKHKHLQFPVDVVNVETCDCTELWDKCMSWNMGGWVGWWIQPMLNGHWCTWETLLQENYCWDSPWHSDSLYWLVGFSALPARLPWGSLYRLELRRGKNKQTPSNISWAAESYGVPFRKGVWCVLQTAPWNQSETGSRLYLTHYGHIWRRNQLP